MKAQLIRRYGKNEKVIINEVAMPIVGDNDVLVAIKAASVNPVDFKTRNGMTKGIMKIAFPMTMGNDFAGEVTAVGAQVTQFKLGDRVYGRPRTTRTGTYAEYIAVNEAELALMPTNLSFEEAASIPLVGLTSYQALTEQLNIQAGDKLFIPSGAGGVGTIAIQIAHLLGARVATTASEKSMATLAPFNPEVVIDYRKQDFSEVLHDYDAIYDTRGGDDLVKSVKILAPHKAVATVAGMPDRKWAQAAKLPLSKQLMIGAMSRKATQAAKKAQAEYKFFFMRPSGEQLAQLTTWLEAGKIVPVIDRVFDFADAQAALDYVEAGHAHGKVIIKIN
ncbi:NADP-dependent oxidoreductase [Periweissella cryptocerci]|uniref:NADP-dependent oxidoreductase n=1 Tax=Periweissella cryptocerci TaxID=2506420 RepID=A0A4P6YWC8_9LACO|nr:NADP-dependent oxidoreductase [Periweissella cryptocerci]QBO37120.1 NADP-dependent oxidoreductase [Periweissella cryptocerci]